MFSLIYRSVAEESFSNSAVYQMLSAARDLNAEHDITGCLLFHNRRFLQLLEGEKEQVYRLFSLIESDPRHKNIEVIQTEEKAERLFNKWSMAFYDYGNLALSAQIKLAQIDTFFEDSQALKTQSRLTNPFFNEVRNMLIERAI
jgi:hypothetical protein